MNNHGEEENEIINAQLSKFSKIHGVKLIATNNTKYISKEDANAHDILLCVKDGQQQSTPLALPALCTVRTHRRVRRKPRTAGAKIGCTSRTCASHAPRTPNAPSDMPFASPVCTNIHTCKSEVLWTQTDLGARWRIHPMSAAGMAGDYSPAHPSRTRHRR